MPRRLLTAATLGLVMPIVGISAQTRVTGVLHGSLVLLPASDASADVRTTKVASIAPTPPPRTAGQLPWFGFQDADPTRIVIRASIRAVVSATGEGLVVWAPDAERIELRPDDDAAPSGSLECGRGGADSTAPATCSPAAGLPHSATLIVYLRTDGSR